MLVGMQTSKGHSEEVSGRNEEEDAWEYKRLKDRIVKQKELELKIWKILSLSILEKKKK